MGLSIRTMTQYQLGKVGENANGSFSGKKKNLVFDLTISVRTSRNLIWVHMARN